MRNSEISVKESTTKQQENHVPIFIKKIPNYDWNFA